MGKKFKKPSLHEMAVTLCEGGIVEVYGHTFRAKEASDEFFPCQECRLDSECHGLVGELCAECDHLTKKDHYLVMDDEIVEPEKK